MIVQRRESSSLLSSYPTVDMIQIYRKKDTRAKVYDQLIKIVSSTQYVGRNQMDFRVVSKELEIGDRYYSNSSEIMMLDKKIGK